MTSSVKKYFISRYTDGMIMEVDYSQLEIVVLAHLSQDEQLIQDIKDGIDMHTVRAAEMFRIPESAVTKDQRTLAKRFSFQLQYGSGAKNMAEKNGTTVETAQAFIDAYYRRYPQVKNWQEEVKMEVLSNRTMSTKKTPQGRPAGVSVIQSETGRLYTFTETDAPDWMRRWGTARTNTSFKPTELKNYMVQGTATGDIVPMMLGKVYRWLISSEYADKACLINTVHDSIVLDVQADVCYYIGVELKKILQDAPKYYENIFGYKFTLPLNVEVTCGKNWQDQDYTIN